MIYYQYEPTNAVRTTIMIMILNTSFLFARGKREAIKSMPSVDYRLQSWTQNTIPLARTIRHSYRRCDYWYSIFYRYVAVKYHIRGLEKRVLTCLAPDVQTYVNSFVLFIVTFKSFRGQQREAMLQQLVPLNTVSVDCVIILYTSKQVFCTCYREIIEYCSVISMCLKLECLPCGLKGRLKTAITHD